MDASACHFKRVAQLCAENAEDNAAAEFRIVPGGDESPFKITPVQGIVYVARPESLDALIGADRNDSVVELRIERVIDGQANGSLVLRVHLTRAANRIDACNSSVFCAEMRTEADCQAASDAISSDQRGCSWRQANFTQSPSRFYSTCSADLATCPDG